MNDDHKIPVVLHTDIGTDIDDTWALSMLLSQPWWDLKMILVDTGDVRYRAAVAAKTLAAFQQYETEIGLGKETKADSSLSDWLNGYDLKQYPGPVHQNGISRFIEIVRNSPEPVHLISIAPVPAIAAALDIAPDIAQRIRFSGMFGSLKYGFDDQKGALAEYNITSDIPAARKVFSAAWLDARITPLDSCGSIRLREKNFQRVFHSELQRLAPIQEGFPIWCRHVNLPEVQQESSILFDTVAVHLAYSTEFLIMEQLPLIVNNEGFTVVDPAGQTFSVATGWKNRAAFERRLAEQLLD